MYYTIRASFIVVGGHERCMTKNYDETIVDYNSIFITLTFDYSQSIKTDYYLLHLPCLQGTYSKNCEPLG